MNVSSRCFSQRFAACVLLSLGIVGVSHAALPTHGLGQAFPQTTNRSMSALWRVYVFQRDGVRYMQINDSQGVVRAAFATANGVFLALPMGTDANRVVVPLNASATSNGFERGMSTCGGACSGNGISPLAATHIAAPAIPNAGSLIYQDPTLQIRVTEDTQGHQVWRVIALPSLNK